ncbi:GlxA family transcriptional regulator [Granulosicoccus antarcticus]|uniref:HTH-type transcriptional regulator CdhR n=1 Tax=Granulosicoccus antarcticus IMCC3135 TaxID=1192854 RepID=A0A2Z2NS67_9GAMM|nr:GlxA family transcriptional regulator [Granulosicoccus antarcticus]ASJ72578.1 HTH-type transcriptional regulator CdhR [Granulosicoccus antarcticus IMCC3135]
MSERSGESNSGLDCTRFGVVAGQAEQCIAFFLPDTFGMLPFISAVEPLRAANRFSGRALYQWRLLGSGQANAVANNGMALSVDQGIDDGGRFDRLIVCGPHEPLHYSDKRALRALRQFAARGTLIGALDTGSYLLAQAELIKHRRCTIHWENLPGFREAFPHIVVSSELFEDDEGLFTCAGGTASLDMMLAIIGQDHGPALALQVAELFIATGSRTAADPQRRSIVERAGIHHAGLASCIELMEANLDQPIGTAELAAMINLSVRQLERLFRTHLQTTPTLYYQKTRLRAGHELLRQTTMSVLDVATAVGFTSTDYFSRRFRILYGYSPTEARKRQSAFQVSS